MIFCLTGIILRKKSQTIKESSLLAFWRFFPLIFHKYRGEIEKNVSIKEIHFLTQNKRKMPCPSGLMQVVRCV